MNKPFYTIPYLVIPQRVILNKPLWYFDTNNPEGIAKKFKQLKKISGYQYDNKHLSWSNIFGHHFSISIHAGENTWDIHAWDHTGSTTIIRFTQVLKDKETDVLSKENYEKLSEATKAYVQGMITCSGCGVQMEKKEIAGRYFAGVYCEECWEGKWKAIEAKETYN